MRILLFTLFSLISTTLVTAQVQNPIYLKDYKLNTNVVEKLKTTPIATLAADKKTYNINYKVLNQFMPDGKTKIIAYKIHVTKKGNKPFLARTYLWKGEEITNYVSLEQASNGTLTVGDIGGTIMDNCYNQPCESCELNMAGSGMVFCQCASHDEDCLKPDVSFPLRDVMETLLQ